MRDFTLPGFAVVALLTFMGADASNAQRNFTREDTAADKAARMQWWREARIGVRFTWGAFTKVGGEYQGRTWNEPTEAMARLKIPAAEYEKMVATFHPTAFDAKTWANLAVAAGAQYALITAKGEDGFALYKSEVTDYSLAEFTPFKRDAVAEMKAACDAAGLKFGVVFSNVDQHFGAHKQGRAEFGFQQIMEILDRYQPALFEFSGKGNGNPTIDKYMRLAAPAMVVNDGLSGKYSNGGDYAMAFPKKEPAEGYQGFEMVVSLSDTLGYSSRNTAWKRADTVLEMMADTLGKGGNFVINIGPDNTGVVPAEAVKLLQEIGAWLKVNGDAVYGSTAGGLTGLPWGACTRKPGKRYLFVTEWPADKMLHLPGISTKFKRAYLLSDAEDTPLTLENTSKGLSVELPDAAAKALVPVIVLAE